MHRINITKFNYDPSYYRQQYNLNISNNWKINGLKELQAVNLLLRPRMIFMRSHI